MRGSVRRCVERRGWRRTGVAVAVALAVGWLAGCAAPGAAAPPAGPAVTAAGAAAASPTAVSVYILPPLAQPAPVLIDTAPPPMLVEPPPPSAVLGAVWTGGYWAWQGTWVWAAGRWATLPRAGDVWVQPTYEHRDGAVIFIDAHWRSARTAFVPVRPGQRIARAAVAADAGLAPLATGPDGIFVPPPPGSRPGLIVPAPLGTPPALMMALPPVGQVGMRVSAAAAGVRVSGRGIDLGLVRVTAPASATLDGHAHDASLPAEAYLAASMPPVVRALAPAPRSTRTIPSYEAGQPAPVLPAPQAVGSDRAAASR